MFTISYLTNLIYWYLRPFIKWFLHRTTRLCELQRICYGAKPGAHRVTGIEHSLELSNSKDIKDLVKKLNKLASDFAITIKNEKFISEEATRIVLRAKKINPQIHTQFVISFSKCVEQIWCYRQLYHQVENLRTTAYDSDNPEHERKLHKLWNLLVPDTTLEGRITKQWQYIGFQGDDPKTDFRGMGLLGLENLIYFAEEYRSASNHVLSHSLHPQYGYTFAIVGINLTSMAYRLLKDGSAKTHMFNVSRSPSIHSFHQLYCYLFYEFDRHWVESKPQSIMDFSFIQERFENSIRSALANSSTVFKINITIDNI